MNANVPGTEVLMAVHHHTSWEHRWLYDMHLVQQSSNQFYFEMILCNMGQIIVRKYRNICRIRHGNHSSRYTCNSNARPIDFNLFKYMSDSRGSGGDPE